MSLRQPSALRPEVSAMTKMIGPWNAANILGGLALRDPRPYHGVSRLAHFPSTANLIFLSRDLEGARRKRGVRGKGPSRLIVRTEHVAKAWAARCSGRYVLLLAWRSRSRARRGRDTGNPNEEVLDRPLRNSLASWFRRTHTLTGRIFAQFLGPTPPTTF
jgi:hypothetical protein